MAQAYQGAAEIRGEFTLVIGPPTGGGEAANPGEVDALLRRALRQSSMKDAVSSVAAATGRPRREIYQRALMLSENQGSDDGTAT